MTKQAKQAPTTAAAKPSDFVILPMATFNGALFNNESANDNAPIMTGSVTIDGKKIPLAGFLKPSKGEQGKHYLSLSIGEKDGIHYYGVLFRSETGYFGSLDLRGGADAGDSQTAFDKKNKLVIHGERKRNPDGSARIALTFAPTEVADEELAY